MHSQLSRLRSTTASLCLLLSTYACSSGDSDKPQEVVAPSTEKTPYAEDPSLAQAEKKEAATPPAADNPAPNESAAVGELTNDQAPAVPPPGAEPPVAEAPPPSPEDDGDAVGGALAQNNPSYQPAPGSLPPEEPSYRAAASGKGKHGHAHKTKAHGAGRSVRYVSAHLLNVRRAPSLKAAKVRQLTGGSEVKVEMHGKWAKIKKGEWVRTKYLSEAPVR